MTTTDATVGQLLSDMNLSSARRPDLATVDRALARPGSDHRADPGERTPRVTADHGALPDHQEEDRPVAARRRHQGRDTAGKDGVAPASPSRRLSSTARSLGKTPLKTVDRRRAPMTQVREASAPAARRPATIRGRRPAPRRRSPSNCCRARLERTTSSTAWSRCGTTRAAGGSTPRTRAVRTASRRRCPVRRWPRPGRTGRPTRPPRSSGASVSFTARYSDPVRGLVVWQANGYY